MTLKVYAMRDLKTTYMAPTVEQNDAQAARNFESAVQQSNGVLFTHRSDFQLFRIGEYDTEKGKLIPEEIPVLIVDGKDIVG